MDKFEYEYSSADEGKKREIERIRAMYAQDGESDMEKLKRLNKKARMPATVCAAATGVCGTLLFGTGMCLSIEFDNLLWGIIVGLAGIVVLAVTVPLHSLLIKRGRKKYGKEIVELSDKMLER